MQKKTRARLKIFRNHPALLCVCVWCFVVHDAPGHRSRLRLRHSSRAQEAVIPAGAWLLSDESSGLKQAAIAGLGIVALPGFLSVETKFDRGICGGWYRAACRDYTITASRSPTGKVCCPSVRVFLDAYGGQSSESRTDSRSVTEAPPAKHNLLRAQ